MKIKKWKTWESVVLASTLLTTLSPVYVAQAATSQTTSSSSSEPQTATTQTTATQTVPTQTAPSVSAATTTSSANQERAIHARSLLAGTTKAETKEATATSTSTTTSDADATGTEDEKTATTYTGLVDFSGNVTDKNSIVGALLTVVNQTTGETVEMSTGLNSQGQTQVSNLPYGTYDVKVRAAPDGFIGLDGSQGTLTVTANGANFVGTITSFQGSLTVENVTETGQALPGGTFTLTNTSSSSTSNQQTATADAQGRVTFNNLSPGSYQLLATKGSDGYLVNTQPQVFQISDTVATKDQANISKTWTNYQGKATLKLVNQQGTALANSLFQLQGPTGATKEYSTDASGAISVDQLSPGVYTFTQTKAPAGYLLNQHTVSFKVGSEAQGDPGFVPLSNFVNYPGSISFQNSTDSNQLLAGGTFQVTNTTTHQQVTVTAADKRQAYTVIGPGSYTLKQVTAPTGYILNQETLNFTIPQQATDEPVAVNLPQFTNYQGTVKGTKVSEDEKPLANTEFELVDKKTGKAVKTVETDKNGEFSIEGIAPGQYELRETKAAKGYIQNDKTYPVTIPATEKGKPAVIRISKSYGYKGTVKVVVTDAVAKHLVANGVYKITGPNGFEKRVEANDNGELYLADLPPGTYTIEQVTAADGYQKSTRKWTVTIASSGQGLPDQKEVKVKVIPKTKNSEETTSAAEDATDSTSVDAKAGGEAAAGSTAKSSFQNSLLLWGGFGALAVMFLGIGALIFYLMKQEQAKKEHE